MSWIFPHRRLVNNCWRRRNTVALAQGRPISGANGDLHMRRILLAGAALAFIATPAFAKNSAIPAQNPVATVVLPDDWDADEIDNGVEVTSKDDEIYMAFEVTKASKAEAALNEGLDYLKGKGVKLDDSSMKQEELT